MQRLLLIDLDGTLVDSAPDIANAANAALYEHGHKTQSELIIRDAIGGGAPRLIHRLLTGTAEENAEPADFEPVMQTFLESYSKALFVRSKLYPGVAATLRKLAQDNWRFACVTNKPERFAEPMLRAAGVFDLFDCVVGGDTVSHKKPHQLPLKHAMKQCGATRSQCVMVGDSTIDYKAARNAGVPVVLVSYGYARGVALSALQPERLINKFSELPAALDELNVIGLAQG